MGDILFPKKGDLILRLIMGHNSTMGKKYEVLTSDRYGLITYKSDYGTIRKFRPRSDAWKLINRVIRIGGE